MKTAALPVTDELRHDGENCILVAGGKVCCRAPFEQKALQGCGTLGSGGLREESLGCATRLGLLYVTVNIYSRSSLAVFRSPVPLDLLVMARGLTAGLSVAALLDFVLPRQQWRSIVKFFFGFVCVVFLLNNLFWGAFAILGRIPAGGAVNLVRHVSSLDAFLFGWAVALLVFLKWKKGQADVGPMEPEGSEELRAES